MSPSEDGLMMSSSVMDRRSERSKAGTSIRCELRRQSNPFFSRIRIYGRQFARPCQRPPASAPALTPRLAAGPHPGVDACAGLDRGPGRRPSCGWPPAPAAPDALQSGPRLSRAAAGLAAADGPDLRPAPGRDRPALARHALPERAADPRIGRLAPGGRAVGRGTAAATRRPRRSSAPCTWRSGRARPGSSCSAPCRCRNSASSSGRSTKPRADAYVKRTRERFGMRLLSRAGGLRRRRSEILRGNGCVGVLFDQNAGDQGALTTLFGRVCSTTELPGLLAAKFGAEVRTFYPRRTGFWRVAFRIRPDRPRRHGRGRHPRPQPLAGDRPRSDESLCASWLWAHDRWRHQDVPARRLRLESKRDLLADDLAGPRAGRPARGGPGSGCGCRTGSATS